MKRPAVLRRRYSSAGFTMIEIMIVVAIIGVLAAIAIPNYDKIVARARRSAAQDVLMQIAMKQTKYLQFTRTGFAGDHTVAGQTAVAILNIDQTQGAFGDYDFTVEADSPPPRFFATATPKSGGRMVTDGWLKIDYTGLRTTGTGSTATGNW